MTKQCLWTRAGGRLQYQSSSNNSALNWIFMPGGPGLGSEALAGLTSLLKDNIPGVIWHFDLPNDGSNTVQGKSISNWRSSLMEAVTALENVILVAHSTPAMYVQTMPELEEWLQGLVLIGSAPDASWQKAFNDYCLNNRDADIEKAEVEYKENPTNETLRQLLIVSAKHCFVTEKSLAAGKALFKRLPINNAACEQSAMVFDSETYRATWIPQNIRTIITTGSNDHITPLSLYKNNKAYLRDNIIFKEITGAGHYPWFENPNEMVSAFEALQR